MLKATFTFQSHNDEVVIKFPAIPKSIQRRGDRPNHCVIEGREDEPVNSISTWVSLIKRRMDPVRHEIIVDIKDYDKFNKLFE